MKIETLELAGLGPAVLASRLPRQGETKSGVHSRYDAMDEEMLRDYERESGIEPDEEFNFFMTSASEVYLHQDDLALLTRLVKSSDSEAKCVRGIIVYARITAPIDFWCELETYRAGHERLCSESTMNQEGKKLRGKALREELNKISFGREITKIDYFSYQALRNIFYWRRKHRKPEWWDFCNWIKSLPLADELILAGMDTTVASEDDE